MRYRFKVTRYESMWNGKNTWQEEKNLIYDNFYMCFVKMFDTY